VKDAADYGGMVVFVGGRGGGGEVSEGFNPVQNC